MNVFVFLKCKMAPPSWIIKLCKCLLPPFERNQLEPSGATAPAGIQLMKLDPTRTPDLPCDLDGTKLLCVLWNRNGKATDVERCVDKRHAQTSSHRYYLDRFDESWQTLTSHQFSTEIHYIGKLHIKTTVSFFCRTYVFFL